MGRVLLEKRSGDFLRPEDAALMNMICNRLQLTRKRAYTVCLRAGVGRRVRIARLMVQVC